MAWAKTVPAGARYDLTVSGVVDTVLDLGETSPEHLPPRLQPWAGEVRTAELCRRDEAKEHERAFVHAIAEDGRIALRNVRRDILADMRELEKEGDIGEDAEKRAEGEVQKVTDAAVAEIDSLLEAKEKEILEV